MKLIFRSLWLRLRTRAVLSRVLLSWLLVTVSSLESYAQSSVPADPAYQQSFGKWKTELTDDLKENWISLAGLFWLKPGENTFGSASDNAVVLPKGPAHSGTFVLTGSSVEVTLLPGTKATVEGKAVDHAELQSDVSGKATVVELASLRMHVIARGSRIGIRVRDTASESARKFRGLEFYPLDLSYRVTGTWVPSDGKHSIDVPDVLGDINPTPITGEVHFQLAGHEVRLTDLGGNPANGLFFVFNDLTSKGETYPGGRFLETDPVTNGTVVLDFNRAHNPPCAVTAYATCPLAPKENRLDFAIPVGERYDHLHKLH